MNTFYMFMCMYDGKPIVPTERICEDFFPHLTPQKFLRKVSDGKIELPLIQVEGSQKSTKGIDLRDFAEYMDKRRAEGREAFERLHH